MAPRKTIRVNPLDSLVPDRTTTRRTGGSAERANIPSDAPTSTVAGPPTLRNQSKSKNGHIATLATQIAQPPSPADLSSRIQSLEEQNEYMKWLLGGTILLAVLL